MAGNSGLRRFEDRVALVSGAASGIGRATAIRLASEGASVLCVDLQPEALEETVKSCAETGSQVESSLCDVSDPAAIEALIQQGIDRFGKLDVLCNIAGILRMDHTHELELEAWNKVLQVNLTGTFLMCKAALPHLIESGGNIVNTSSTSALAGLPYGAAYASSKGGVKALTRAIAVEYAKRGVRANSVCPGSVTTGMTTRSMLPEGMDFSLMQRLMPLDEPRGPETVAGVIAMLASADGAHINGEEIRVDGGTLA
jgi:meso-butanediol dehydrogenase/(S,S)-butanediol dehydrogenase/diacetyl reductase